MRSLQEILSEIATVPDVFGPQMVSFHYRNVWGNSSLYIDSRWTGLQNTKLAQMSVMLY